jgi:hypothetical protein
MYDAAMLLLCACSCSGLLPTRWQCSHPCGSVSASTLLCTFQIQLPNLFPLTTLQERECEHLRQIIKELSQSRSKAHKTKVELEEQFAGLQKEYYRWAV